MGVVMCPGPLEVPLISVQNKRSELKQTAYGRSDASTSDMARRNSWMCSTFTTQTARVCERITARSRLSGARGVLSST